MHTIIAIIFSFLSFTLGVIVGIVLSKDGDNR